LINSNLNFVIGAGKQLFDGTMEGSPYKLRDFEKKGFFVADIFKTPVNVLPTNSTKRILFFNGTETALVRSLGVDHLKKASKKAISYLNKREPYFLMIEGAQIDWACHAGNKDEFIYRMKVFELAIEEVLNHVRKDKNTLLVITADHATGGLSIKEGSKKGDVKLDFSTNGHTGTMVPIFAYGPGSELFRGVMENTEIFDKMTQLLNLPKPSPNVN
jgi:alkaline phosphatase